MKIFYIILPLSFVIFLPSISFGVEVTPRISNKEIIESLATLKEGQRAINERINQVEVGLNERINQVEKNLNERIDQVERSINQRFDDLKWFIGTMMGILMIINGAVLGYVLKRQGSIEKSLETQQDEINFLKSVVEKLLPPKGVL